MTNPLADATQAALNLPDGTLLNNVIVVAQTITDLPDGGVRYDLHRLYPINRPDPSTERGLLADAIYDSREQRRN